MNTKNDNLKKYIIPSCAILLFILDRLTKYLIINDLFGERCFFITLLKNKGVAFSLALPEQMGVSFYVLIGIILIFLSTWFVRSWKEKLWGEVCGLLLVIIGAISNLIDRIKYGSIIDFIDLKIWPVFNIADTMIVVGAVLLIWQYLRDYKLKR